MENLFRSLKPNFLWSHKSETFHRKWLWDNEITSLACCILSIDWFMLDVGAAKKTSTWDEKSHTDGWGRCDVDSTPAIILGCCCSRQISFFLNGPKTKTISLAMVRALVCLTGELIFKSLFWARRWYCDLRLERADTKRGGSYREEKGKYF
jgi:hypothetical protein